jgi:hypothetical protein
MPMWERISRWGWIIVFDLVIAAMIFAGGFRLAAHVAQYFGWR